jgi:8-oxo-dGTP pyrophosphatase MutT (NUDIX family)
MAPRHPPIEISARVVLTFGDRVLLANRRGENWFFLPGGNVLPGESVEAALHREIDAETGLDIDIDDIEFVGCVEHVYVESGTQYHELNVLFGANVPRWSQIGSRKDEIHLASVALRALPSLELRPASLGEAILRWLRTNRPGWQPAAPRIEK